MRSLNRFVAFLLSFFVFLMCFAPCNVAAAEKKGSKIEIRMTKEVPIKEAKEPTTAQWIKDNKWWLALGAGVVGGLAVSLPGKSEKTNTPDNNDSGSVYVGW